jgi:hypothetical protein
MRMMLGLTLLAAGAALAGCGKSAEARMEEARKEIGDACRKSPPPLVNANQYCNCVVEKSIGTKTAAQMAKMGEKESEQLGAKAGTECLRQPGMMPAPAAPASEEAIVKDKAIEPVKEGVDEAN